MLRPISHRALSAKPSLPRSQRRWARVHDIRFVATAPERVQQAITDKYRHKLEQKARAEGKQTVDELKDAYKDKIHDLRRRAVAGIPGAKAGVDVKAAQQAAAAQSNEPVHLDSSDALHAQSRQSQHGQSQQQQEQQQRPDAGPLDQLSPSSPHYKPPGVKTLSSFMEVDKIATLPPKEIEALWRLRHAGNTQSLAASIAAPAFEAMLATARKHPQFILPGLPREPAEGEGEGGQAVDGKEAAEKKSPLDGTPIHFLQWTFPAPNTVTVLFTHLAEYKLRLEHSQPHTTLTMHTELLGSKGLALCQGNVIESRGVSVEEGKWLVMCLQKFYNTKEAGTVAGESDTGLELNRRRRDLLQKFTEGSSAFSVESLLEEAERLG